MKKTPQGTIQNQIIIGIPNAMLYYRYKILWNRFFTELGVKVSGSGQTTKELIGSGMETAIDETCLSSKIYMGHVEALIGKCDYILIPRISNWGRNRSMCTRFESLYDLICNTFRNTNQKFICYNVDISKKMTEETALLALGMELGFSKKATLDAYKKAKKEESIDWKNHVKLQEQLYKSDNLKIMIAAHSYVLEDSYLGKPIIDYLTKLGTVPIRADIVDRKEALKQSQKVSSTLKWEMNREIAGNLQMHRDKIDGIILISAFPCGPDSMVNEMIARSFRELPVLKLILDTQTGTAGIETRLESFVDILKLKKGTL